MIRRCEAAVLTLLLVALTGCAHAISGTATWPGARLEKVVLTADDFPAGAHFDRIILPARQPGAAGGPPAMLSHPERRSDRPSRPIAETAGRGPGRAPTDVSGHRSKGGGACCVGLTAGENRPPDATFGCSVTKCLPPWSPSRAFLCPST